MIGVELARFDKTAILFAAFSILALIRERTILPFLICVVGALFQGPLVSCAMAALVVWHRIARGCGKWIQLKDFAAFFFILAGAVASDPEQALFSWLGIFLIAINFGGSALGTLPALLFLRQYHSIPEFLEIALVGHALYWILVEASRWTEIPSGHLVLSWAEILGSALILSSFRGEMELILSVPALAAAGAGIMALVFSLFMWIQFRPLSFQGFYRTLQARVTSILFFGERWISGREPWAGNQLVHEEPGFGTALNGFFWWLVSFIVVAALAWTLSRGANL